MAEFRFATPDYNYNGIIALGKGLGDYATGLKSQRDQDVLAKALTKFDGSNYNDVAKALLEAKQPEAALKMFQLGQKSAEWGVNPVTGEYYNKNSLTPPTPSQQSGPAESTTYQYPPGIDTPAQRMAFDKARVTQAGKDAAAVGSPTVQKAKDDVTSNLSDMIDSYLDLDARGGTVDPSKDTLSNVKAYLGATGPGQQLGGSGILGKEALARTQDIQTINSIRPMLINAIRQATKQGARGLDSNVELQFYLQQATDPKYGKKVNLAAIDRLDRAYGLGGLLDKKLTPDQLKEIRSTKLSLPSGIKETNIPYDAAQEAPPQQSTAPQFGAEYEGKTLKGPDNKLYIIKNGQPVPVGQ